MGNMVSKVIDGGQLDMKVKNAKYVDKNNTVQLNHSWIDFTMQPYWLMHKLYFAKNWMLYVYKW